MNENKIFWSILAFCGIVFVVETAKVPSSVSPTTEHASAAPSGATKVFEADHIVPVSETPADFNVPVSEGKSMSVQVALDLINTGDKPKMVTGCRLLLSMTRQNRARYDAGTASQQEHDLLEGLQPMFTGCEMMILKFG